MNSREKVNYIYEAVNTIEKLYEKWSKMQGIEYYDMQLYYALIENNGKPMTQKQFCDEMDIPKTTVNSIVKKQINLGYIRLEVNPNNRKEKLVILTPKGIEYAHQLIDPLFEIENEAIELLSDDETLKIVQSLSKFSQSLSGKLGL